MTRRTRQARRAFTAFTVFTASTVWMAAMAAGAGFATGAAAQVVQVVQVVQVAQVAQVAQAAPGNAAPHATVPAVGDGAAPRPAPRYLLQGPNGRAVTSEDFRGRFQLVAFGFTSCPDVCPTTLLEVQQLLQALGPQAAKVQALFITVDPQRDSAPVLKEYTAAFDPRILGLTGSAELVARAAQAFGVQYRQSRAPDAPENVYTVDHSTGMVLLGPEGQWLRRIGYGTPVPRMLQMLQRAFEGEAP